MIFYYFNYCRIVLERESVIFDYVRILYSALSIVALFALSSKLKEKAIASALCFPDSILKQSKHAGAEIGHFRGSADPVGQRHSDDPLHRAAPPACVQQG